MGGLSLRQKSAIEDPPSTDPSYDWPSVFRPGDIVRGRDGDSVGVVLLVGDYSGDESPKWELHVDFAVDGRSVGVNIINPWDAIGDTSRQRGWLLSAWGSVPRNAHHDTYCAS